MTNKENASLISVDESIQEVSVKEYNVKTINSISKLYPGFRQDSKMP